MDSGLGRKLERFDRVVVVRPEPKATWSPSLTEGEWDAADGAFLQADYTRGGEWKFPRPIPPRWVMRRKNISFWVQPTPSGHMGVFPDQAIHWDWISSVVKSASVPIKALSLFGYTGLATLSAAAAGAHVTHVDASRKAVKWARENQILSQLTHCPIRWIVEDALTFVKRQVRRGHTYDALILDPPRFGRGPNGQIWKLNESLPLLLRECQHLLSATPSFILINLYTTVLTQRETAEEITMLNNSLTRVLAGYAAVRTSGEIVLQDSAGREIPASVFSRAVIQKRCCSGIASGLV